jgi:phosphopantetheinyl transferase
MHIGHRELAGQSAHDAGRELLGQMYREVTGQALPEIFVTERGKPYFATGDVHFSISHTKRRVFCVLSDQPVGIDAEEMDRNIDLDLADKILSEKENAAIRQRQISVWHCCGFGF